MLAYLYRSFSIRHRHDNHHPHQRFYRYCDHHCNLDNSSCR